MYSDKIDILTPFYRVPTFSLDGNFIASADNGTGVQIWSINYGEFKPLVNFSSFYKFNRCPFLQVNSHTYDHKLKIINFAFSVDSNLLAIAYDTCCIKIWNWNTVQLLTIDYKQICQIEFSGDDRFFIVSGFSSVCIFSTLDWNLVYEWTGEGYVGKTIFKLSDDCNKIFVHACDIDETVYNIIDLSNFQLLYTKSPDGFVSGGLHICSSDFTMMINAGDSDFNYDIKILTLNEQWKNIKTFHHGYEFPLDDPNYEDIDDFDYPQPVDILLYPDNKWVIAIIDNGDLQVWNIETEEVVIYPSEYPLKWKYRLSMSNNGDLIYSNKDRIVFRPKPASPKACTF